MNNDTRNCEHTCHAGWLEHAIRLAQNQLERIAVRVCAMDHAHPHMGWGTLWYDLCEVIDDLETDIQGFRDAFTLQDLILLEEEPWDAGEDRDAA